MARGSKAKYTDKQKRRAEHIEDSYERRGVPHEEAERRAWATVNAETGGGKKSGSGRGKPENREPHARADVLAAGPRRNGPAARSASARKGAATRKRRASR